MTIALLGIDGLDPDLLDRWQDDLPTLSRILQRGTTGRLRSTDPPFTSPAWPSFYTGKQGGKHGVFGFTKEVDGGYERRPINFDDIFAETLWEALDAEGIKCGVVNVPLTYPPSELEHGFVVAGWPVPHKVNPATPTGILKELETQMGESYQVNPFPLTIEFEQLENEELFEEIKEGLWHHKRAFEYLWEANDIDVFFGVFMAIDIASHNFAWDREYLHDMYVEQDRAVGELLARFPDETDVVLVSDHGHGARSRWSFHVNQWLQQENFLERVENGRPSIFERLGITQTNYVRIKNAFGLGDVHRLLPSSLYQFLKDRVPREGGQDGTFDPSQVRWRATTAFSSVQNEIFLNTERLPEGTVRKEEASEVRKKVCDSLQEVPHPAPDRDDPLVTEIATREELFDGPYVEWAPDIVFIADEMRCNAPMGFAGGDIFASERWGEHRQFGVLITAGPSFTGEADDKNRDIKDVFPTVLALAGCAIPDNVDGDVLGARLTEEPKIEFREPRDSESSQGGYTETASEEIREQLEGLGYLE